MHRIVYHTLLISHLSKFMALNINCAWLLRRLDAIFRRTRNEMITWNMEKLRNTFHKLSPKYDDVIDTYLSANRMNTAMRVPQPGQLLTSEADWWKKKKKKLNLFEIEKKKLFMHLIKLTYKQHYFMTALFAGTFSLRTQRLRRCRHSFMHWINAVAIEHSTNADAGLMRQRGKGRSRQDGKKLRCRSRVSLAFYCWCFLSFSLLSRSSPICTRKTVAQTQAQNSL